MENTSMLNKTPDQLTVGEIVKINAGFVAAYATVAGLILVTPTLVEKARGWNYNRKLNKNIEVTEA